MIQSRMLRPLLLRGWLQYGQSKLRSICMTNIQCLHCRLCNEEYSSVHKVPRLRGVERRDFGKKIFGIVRNVYLSTETLPYLSDSIRVNFKLLQRKITYIFGYVCIRIYCELYLLLNEITNIKTFHSIKLLWYIVDTDRLIVARNDLE